MSGDVSTDGSNQAAPGRGLAEQVERLWSQALVAVSNAEDEGARMVARLAAAAGWSQEEMKRQAQQLGQRLSAHRQELERAMEVGVRQTLQALRVPRRDAVQELSARLDGIARRIDALAEKRSGR